MAGAMATTNSKKDLWQEALGCLSDEDRKEIESTEKLESLNKLHEAAESRRQECIDKGWSVYKKKDGTKVKLRHVLEKIAGAADQIIALGTLAVGFDTSGHASAPWAVVKMLISGTASNIKVFVELGEGLEMVSDTLARFAIIEQLYLGKDADTTHPLEKKILELYAQVLTYLAAAKRYFSASSIGKLGLGIVDSMSKRYKEMQKSLSEDDANKWVKLADARLQEKRDKKGEARYDILKRALDNVQQPVMRMVQQLSDIQDNLEEGKRRKLLEWLSTIEYQNHHTLGSRNLLSNSGLWLLESDEFVNWKTSTTSSALWLHGSPGTGKTSIVSQVIDNLRRDGVQRNTCPIAYFYCSRQTQEPERADPDKIMNTILKQLASSSSASEPIRQPVVAEYTKRSRDLSADAKPQKLLAAESAAICVQLCQDNPAYIVVDALDECNDLRRYELLEALDEIMRKSQETVKVFLSSRSDIDVSLHIRDNPLSSINVVSEKNQQDISKFVRSEVRRLDKKNLLLNGNLSSSLRKKTVQVLEDGAQGMFRWVVLSLETLRMRRDVLSYKEILGKLPPHLSDLYKIVYEDIEKDSQATLHAVELVLSLLIAGQRNLETEELVSAVFSLSDDSDSGSSSDGEGSSDYTNSDIDTDTDTDTDSEDTEDIEDGEAEHDHSSIRAAKASAPQSSASPTRKTLQEKLRRRHTSQIQQVVNMCRNLVLIDTEENVFRFSHPSVSEYIMTLPAYRIDRTHARLTRLCVAVPMRKYLPGMTPRDVFLKHFPEGRLYVRNPFLEYCVRNWTYHYGHVSGTPSETDIEFRAELDRFLYHEPDVFSTGMALRTSELIRYIVIHGQYSTEVLIPAFEDAPTKVLHSAVIINSSLVLDQVIARGYDDINEPDRYGLRPLYYAVQQGHLGMTKRLLGLGADLVMSGSFFGTALHLAAAKGEKSMFDALLETGDKCDINALHDGCTPLMVALEYKQHEMALHLMSKPGIDLDTPNLLSWAASYGKGTVVKELLSRTSIDPNRGRDDGTVLLIDAITETNGSTVKVLLDDPRVDIAVCNIYGTNAYMAASMYLNEDILDFFFHHPRVDVNGRDGNGRTALHNAALIGRILSMKFLLTLPEVRVDIRDNYGFTPLDYAIRYGKDSAAELLREHAEAKMIEDSEGSTIDKR